MNIDREGIFKAKPVAWSVKTFEGKQSVALNVEFVIVAMLDQGEWQDWTLYDTCRVWGDFFVVKKDGRPNTAQVQQLAESLGWNGDLRVVFGEPPDVVVQVTVKEETYDGRTFYKAAWVNPEDYVPGPKGGADAATVEQLQTRFGSLLRAAATSKSAPGAKAAAPGAKPAAAAPPPAQRPPAAAAAAQARAQRDDADAAKYGLNDVPF